MNITLGSLETGKWRNLSPLELKGLEALLKDSEKTYTP
jgi:16S rRNA U516 pseudouridylate synthase RsuA-like enzyme